MLRKKGRHLGREAETVAGTTSARRGHHRTGRVGAGLSDDEHAVLSLSDALGDGVAILDAEGRVKAVNGRLLEMLGIPERRITGVSLDLLMAIRGRGVSKRLPGLFSGREVHPFDVETVSKSGQPLSLRVHLVRIARKGDGASAAAVIRDISHMRQLEEQWRVVDERNRLFVENAEEGVVVVQDGVVVFLNQKAADMSGRTVEDCLSKPFLQHVHPADRGVVMQMNLRRIRGEPVPRFHSFRVTRLDGDVRWAEVNAVEYVWEGRPALVSFVRDITERRMAEDRLRESERRYRLLAENASDVIWVTDMNLRPIYLSPSIERLLGYSLEESMSHTVEGAATPGSVEAVQKVLAGVVARGPEKSATSGKMEVELKRKDGTTVWVESTVSFIRGPDGRPVEITGVLRDISKRRLAEEALREAKAKLDLLLQQMPCLCWTTDADLRFSSCAGAPIGASRLNQLMGTKLSDYYGEEDRAPVSAHRQALAGTADSYEVEQGGRAFYCRVEPLRDADNSLVGVVGAAVDVTDYKNLVGQLRTLSRRLISVQEDERRAIASELHDEVGQSLTALRLLLEKAQGMTARIDSRQLSVATAVVNELMTRVREMSLDLRPAMLDDLGLLPTLLWHFKRYTNHTQVKVKFRHGGLRKPLPPEVSIAAYRIVQEALTNVARYARVSEVSVCVRAERRAVLVEVADHGIGFDEARLGSQPTSGLRGMRERALALDGKFTVRSVPGRGTYVMAELPCGPASKKDTEK